MMLSFFFFFFDCNVTEHFVGYRDTQVPTLSSHKQHLRYLQEKLQLHTSVLCVYPSLLLHHLLTPPVLPAAAAPPRANQDPRNSFKALCKPPPLCQQPFLKSLRHELKPILTQPTSAHLLSYTTAPYFCLSHHIMLLVPKPLKKNNTSKINIQFDQSFIHHHHTEYPR